jgi:hypothetical protein
MPMSFLMARASMMSMKSSNSDLSSATIWRKPRARMRRDHPMKKDCPDLVKIFLIELRNKSLGDLAI